MTLLVTPLTRGALKPVLVDSNNRTDRPWGSFFVLEDAPYTKVKKLLVNPGHRLSYQSHKHRDEHWVVVRGVARVTLDDVVTDYRYGDHIFVKRGTRHRIACEGAEPVEIIEVQVGDAFDEDDITRYSDDYDRV
ncbi:MAG TPA: phosphomannose isomerase type II C-terminal cupin domain [Candidatus Obscuribacterales bacterium]